MDKKSFVEVQQFEYMDTVVRRRVIWRYGELSISPDNAEMELVYCSDKSHVEYDDEDFEDFDSDTSEGDTIDRLSNMGYQLVDSWYEIIGRFEARL
jgi:hypothetical protein